jgi:hypothetical protein
VLSVLYLAIAVARSSSSTRVGRVLRVALLTGGTFALGVAPWFAFSLLTTGSLGQKSGAMKMLWASGDYGALAAWERRWCSPSFCAPGGFRSRRRLLFNQTHSVVALAAAIVLLVLVLLSVRTIEQEETSGVATEDTPATLWCQMAAWLLPMLLLSGSVYGLLFADHRAWYWGQPGLSFSFCFYGGRGPVSATRVVGAIFERVSVAGVGVLAYALLLCVLFSRMCPLSIVCSSAPMNQWRGWRSVFPLQRASGFLTRVCRLTFPT